MKKLTPYDATLKHLPEVWTEVHHQEDLVEIHFWAKGIKNLHTTENFSLDHDRNWGLWDFDVFESFLYFEKNRNHPQKVPYLEIQTSPLGQRFALNIEKPRELFFSPQNLNYTVTNEITPDEASFHWKSVMRLRHREAKGSRLWGNLCACLGPADARQYFALSWNRDKVLDFHRPDAFVPLTTLKDPKFMSAKLNTCGALYLLPTPLYAEADLDSRVLKVIQDALSADLANQSVFVFEEAKVARRRWLSWGLPREWIEKFMLYNEHQGAELHQELLRKLKEGKNIYLMSDGGLPGFCDPGVELVDLCHVPQNPNQACRSR